MKLGSWHQRYRAAGRAGVARCDINFHGATPRRMTSLPLPPTLSTYLPPPVQLAKCMPYHPSSWYIIGNLCAVPVWIVVVAVVRALLHLFKLSGIVTPFARHAPPRPRHHHHHHSSQTVPRGGWLPCDAQRSTGAPRGIQKNFFG